MEKLKFKLFSRDLGQTPGTGGFKPCLVLGRNGRVHEASWICLGGGKSYDNPEEHAFVNAKARIQERMDEANIIAFYVLPTGRHQVEVLL